MRSLLVVLLSIFVTVLHAQSTITNPRLLQTYQQIVNLKEEQQYDKAIRVLNKTINKYPEQTDFLNLKVIVILASGPINDQQNDSLALVLLSKAINIDSTRASFYNNRGWVYQLMGQYDKAFNDFNRAVVLEPNNVRVWHNPIRILLIQKDVKQSLDYCNRCITKFPNDGYAYFVRGTILNEFVGNKNLADEDFKKSHELGWEKGIYLIY